MKIMIIGADGQLGTDLAKVIPTAEQIPLTITDLDLTVKEQVKLVMAKYLPDIVINTAAYHQVDNCEDHELPAFAVNTFGVKYLAEACRDNRAALVHLSTDYVFDGEKKTPYVETDAPNPQSIYAISKYAGEQCVKYILPEHFIIRSTGLYGVAGCLGKGGTNFVEGMVKKAATQPELKVVNDEVLSPTYTLDLANNIYALIKTKHYGLYHLVNHGGCSWYDFTVKIFALLGNKIPVKPIKAQEFPTKAKRPHYSIMQNAALAKIGLDQMRPWEEALKAYLIEKGYLQ